jgi:hypothetical protein
LEDAARRVVAADREAVPGRKTLALDLAIGALSLELLKIEDGAAQPQAEGERTWKDIALEAQGAAEQIAGEYEVAMIHKQEAEAACAMLREDVKAAREAGRREMAEEAARMAHTWASGDVLALARHIRALAAPRPETPPKEKP